MVLRSREVGGFVCTETGYAPGQSIGAHSHNTAGIVATIAGGFAETIGNRELSCSARKILFRAPGDVHSDTFGSEGGRCLTIEIPACWDGHSPVATPLFTSVVNGSSATINFARQRLYREFLCEDAASGIALEGLVLELVAEIVRSQSRKMERVGSPRLERAYELVNDRFLEPLSLSNVAAEAGLHPSHLARAFRKEYGMTVGEYIRDLRIARSADLLANSDLSLADISQECGFSDQSHFSRTFKQAYGFTPLRYRKALSAR